MSEFVILNWDNWEKFGKRIGNALEDLGLMDIEAKPRRKTSQGLIIEIKATIPLLTPPYLVIDQAAQYPSEKPSQCPSDEKSASKED